MSKINFNELTLENFHQWPHFLKYSLLIFFAILCCFLNYWLIFSSNFSQYKILTNEEIHLKAEFENKQQLANVKAYKNQLQAIEKIYGNRLKLLVKKNEISSLLNEISQAGVSSGLIFELFAPKIEEKKAGEKELIINMEILGEYHNIALFLSNVADFNRLITFADFEIVKEDRDNEKQNSLLKNNNLLRMKIIVKIHRNIIYKK